MKLSCLVGAGNGSRTRLSSLGRTRSTAKLYPLVLDFLYKRSKLVYFIKEKAVCYGVNWHQFPVALVFVLGKF